MESRLRIGLLTVSAIPDDPRVRRQGDLFHAAGYDVIGQGLAGWRSALPDWFSGENDAAAPSATASLLEPGRWRRMSAVRMAANAGRGHAIAAAARAFKFSRHVAVHAAPSVAEPIYWDFKSTFADIHAAASRDKADLWLANDWTSLPIAQRLAREQGVPYLYDTHELAAFEFSQRIRWRLKMRPVIVAIERAGIRAAAGVSCVSDGIADRLQSFHGLQERPAVIRNMPHYRETNFRPAGARINVLYHGIVAPGRAFEETIRSVSEWRDEFHLTIRGPGPQDYMASLKALAERAGAAGRVTFAPPVPMTELVQEAAAFDVGFFAIRGHSLQNTYVLPNKFFEYTMAGLALCVSDLPEMRRLIDRHGMGVVIPSCEPGEIAHAINSLTRARIDQYKRASLDAARMLSWENEGQAFLAMAERALSEHGTRSARGARP